MSFNKSALLRATFLAVAAISVLPLAGRALAQAPKPSNTTIAQADQAPAEMGEIVVTARKREETLLEVPVVVTPISQTQLESRQTEDLKDVAKFVPGLVLGQTL